MIERGNGKVILLGEHAVVYGVPAIAGALSLGARATAQGGPIRLALVSSGVEVTPGDGSPLGAAFGALLQAREERALAGERVTARAIEAHIELPSDGGLGSSAALAVAVLRALDRADAIERGFDRSQAVALAWERIFHGQPSGIDTALALAGGLVRYRRAMGGEPAQLERLRAPAVTLIVAQSGARGATKETVARVAAKKAEDEVAFARALAAFEASVRAGERALLAGELAALGQELDRCHALLASWGVSTPTLDAMCELARGQGALGAKLTGGGGGGSMIALAPTAAIRAKVRAALSDRGWQSFEATIGEPPRPLETT